MAEFETSYKEYMPLIAPAATDTERAAEYQAALDVMTLGFVLNGRDSAYWYEYRVYGATLSAETLESYKKLYMPTRGMVFYFPSGATLPNGNQAMGTTLMIKPGVTSMMNWSKLHPAYGAFVTEMYFANFDEAEADLKLKGYLTSDPVNKDFLAFLYKTYVSTTLPDEAAIATAVYDLFKGSLAGKLGIYVSGGDELTTIAADGSSTDTFLLQCHFTNSHTFPLASGDDYYEAFFTEVRGSPDDDDDALDQDDTVEFFRYRQRIRDSEHTFAHLAAHPMIVLLTAFDAGASTGSLTDTNRTEILGYYAICSRVDFVDYENAIADKYADQFNYVDMDADAVTIMLAAPFSSAQSQALTGQESVVPTDILFDYYVREHDSEIRSLNIYNPDNCDLDYVSSHGYVSVYTGGNYQRAQIYFTRESTVTSALSAPVIDTISVKFGPIVVREIRVMICPTMVIPGKVFNVQSQQWNDTYDVADTIGNGTNSYLFEHTYAILGHIANIFFYPTAELGQLSVLLDASNNGVIKTNVDKSTTRSPEFQSLLDSASSGFNLFYVYDIEMNEKGNLSKELGVAVGQNAFAEGDYSENAAYEATTSHEMLHAIASGYFGSSGEARHFNHDKGKSGDFMLMYNVSARASSTMNARLTANQVWLLHKKLNPHF